MVQKQPAVEVGHLASEHTCLFRPVNLRLGERFEEQRIKKLAKESVFAALARLIQFGPQVIHVAVVEKEFLLQKPDEHQPVKNDRGVPTAVTLVVNALDLA